MTEENKQQISTDNKTNSTEDKKPNTNNASGDEISKDIKKESETDESNLKTNELKSEQSTENNKIVENKEKENINIDKSNYVFKAVLGLIVGILFFVIVMYAVGVNLVYNLRQDNLALKVTDFFKLPIALVNNQKILYNEFIDQYQALTKANQGLSDKNLEELKTNIIAQLISNEIVNQEFKKFNLKYTDEEINQAFELQAKNSQMSEQEFEKQLQDHYGFGVEKFKQVAILPILKEEKLMQAVIKADNLDEKYKANMVKVKHILITNKENEAEAEKLAKEIIDRINKGEDFSELAFQYTEDPGTKMTGGELGWQNSDFFVPEFKDAVLKMNVGEISSEPVKTQFGYHIIKLEDKGNYSYNNYIMDKLNQAIVSLKTEKIQNPFAQK